MNHLDVGTSNSSEAQSDIDFNAVQRGDAEMEQKLHRMIRACIELGSERNPILSIHDQGSYYSAFLLFPQYSVIN